MRNRGLKGAMIIIVDAYNLLRAIPPYKKTITDQERTQFIAQLGAYGRRKGHKIIIVFDGGPHEWPFKENRKNVQIVYSGLHESADDYIKEFIEAQHAQDLLLVSSDRELNSFAERNNVPSIDVAHFYQLVRQELQAKVVETKKAEVIVKIEHDNNIDIDALMREASKVIPIKSEDFIGQKKSDERQTKLSKHERALLKKLNKL